MIKLKALAVLAALAFNVTINLQGQSSFNTCAAAFLDGEMIVESYAAGAQAEILIQAKGDLTVNEVELDENGGTAKDRVPFMVGIKNKRTNTLMLWSEQPVKQVTIEQVLQQCQKGDSIVLMTIGNQRSLPHHELLVK